MASPALLSPYRAALPSEPVACNNVGCEQWRGGCRCTPLAPPSPREWPQDSDAEMEARNEAQLEAWRWKDINDEREDA